MLAIPGRDPYFRATCSRRAQIASYLPTENSKNLNVIGVTFNTDFELTPPNYNLLIVPFCLQICTHCGCVSDSYSSKNLPKLGKLVAQSRCTPYANDYPSPPPPPPSPPPPPPPSENETQKTIVRGRKIPTHKVANCIKANLRRRPLRHPRRRLPQTTHPLRKDKWSAQGRLESKTPGTYLSPIEAKVLSKPYQAPYLSPI